MKKDKSNKTNNTNLRSKAEKILKPAKMSIENLSDSEVRNLARELQTRQIALEIENEELRKSHQELQNSNGRYSWLYDFAPDGYFTISAEGVILATNLTCAKIFGIERRFLIGKPLNLFILKEDKGSYNLEHRMVCETRERRRCELRMVKEDGTQFYAQLESIAVLDTESDSIQCITIMSDITERKRTEESLRQSEQYLRDITYYSPSLIYMKDLSGKYLFINRLYESMFNLNNNDIVDLTDYDIFPKKIADIFRANDILVAEHGERIEAEELAMHSDGSEHIYLSVKFPVRRASGEIYATCGISTNITGRKKVEEELRNTTSMLKNILDTSPDMVFAKDLKLRTIMCNRAFATAVGKKIEDILGKTDIENGWDSELVYGSPEKGIRGFENDDRQVLNGQIVHNPSDPANVGDEIRIFDTNKLPLYDAQRRIVGVLGVAHDVTDRNNAEEQIKASLKEKNALLMETHHRVKNNMQVLSSLLYFHVGQLKDKQSIKVFKDAQNRIQSMAIIHDILYGSRHLSNIDFDQYVRVLADKLINSFGICPDKIFFKIDISNVILEINRAVPLGLLVNELLTNSLKHAFPFNEIRVDSTNSDHEEPEKERGKYEISLSLTPAPYNQTELIFCDNGVGIPKDLDIDTLDSIGLSLIKIIAEGQLKGKVTLDRSVKGVKFQIIF